MLLHYRLVFHFSIHVFQFPVRSVMALQEDDDNFHSALSMLKNIDINTVYMDSLIFRKRRHCSYSEISMEAGTFFSYSSMHRQNSVNNTLSSRIDKTMC
jgi:hypothetical protein